LKDKLTLIVAALVVVASIYLYYYFEDLIQVGRVGIVLAGVVAALFVAYTCDAGKAAWAFARGANIERQKVVWPNRREAMMVTLMVIVLVIIIGLFIALVDKILFETIYNLILGVSD
jgi:preprotein translocase subunit SecE